MQKVISNMNALAISLRSHGIDILTGGTDNHLLLIDLRNKDITGQELEHRLEEVGIITNKNAVPFDTKNKKETSGLRIGAAAVTSRGLGIDEMRRIGDIIADCMKSQDEFDAVKSELRYFVQQICKRFPLYQD